jgi:hypothetical protein
MGGWKDQRSDADERVMAGCALLQDLPARMVRLPPRESMGHMSRLRSTKISLSATFLALAASVTGCGSSEPDTAQICLDEQTQLRVADEECDENSTTYIHGRRRWRYIPTSYGYPAVGARVEPGTFSTTRPGAGSVSTVKPAGLGGSVYGDGGSSGT